MQIPVFSVYSPSGENEYLFTTLSDSHCNLILNDAKAGLKQKVTDNLVSPFLGLTFRSQDVQIFSFVSCTGWLLIVGFENGPFNGTEVRRFPLLFIISRRWRTRSLKESIALSSRLCLIPFTPNWTRASFSVSKFTVHFNRIQ
jgi:hypothetical protein